MPGRGVRDFFARVSFTPAGGVIVWSAVRHLTPFLTVFVLLVISAAPVRALIVGSFNIRFDAKGDIASGNGWEQRAPVVAGLIRFHNFEVLGIQEALINQLRDLDKLMPGYARLGKGRDDGGEKGEHAAIYYKEAKLRLLEGGDFWLSETPDVPGKKGWDADLPRVCTWAKFEPVDGSGAFFVFNVHFDHRGVQARLESSRLLLAKAAEIAGESPVMLMGDFNVDQNSEAYRILTSAGHRDAYEDAPIRYALNGTFNSFNVDAKTDSRIDHIFLSKDFRPMRYGVLTDVYWAPGQQNGEGAEARDAPREIRLQAFRARLPSDHFPVLVEVERAE
jgi:endonuclease/exonuclease/phosphatase family metal-dependent hydrolase